MKKSVLIIVVIVAIILVIGGILFFTSSQTKKALTEEQFKEKVETKGYTIGEIQNDALNNESVKVAQVAISSDYNSMIEFYILNDNEATNQFYNENKEKFHEKKETNEPIENKKNNYENYSLKANGKYMYIAKIDNTVLQLTVNEAEEQKVMELVKELGY